MRSTIAIVLLAPFALCAQSFPWERPLMIAWSNDGITFDPPSVFQDSSGVPSGIRWHGDTLIAAFQWFRQPNPSPSWDRVAVKFSYDNGASWTMPTPIVVNGLPPNYQRPFDPTLALLGNDSLRIYYSSSAGMPMGLDSTVNTYSAASADGIHYQFEPGARVDVVDHAVIDPAVIQFGPGWHYLAPAGPPQAGAYHYLAPDGITFNAVPVIPSDAQHNWTGNYMVNSPTELRFYGAGQNGIWYNSSPNGGVWNGYVPTNIQGGDPSVLRVDTDTYLMVYVGMPYTTAIDGITDPTARIALVPVPAQDVVYIRSDVHFQGYRILSVAGTLLQEGVPIDRTIRVDHVPAGLHVVELTDAQGMIHVLRMVKQ
ncbi:MAG: hypothetical protein IPP83_10405 [Flavobacteriales bacterium]|nr:hypothetical protein [Flavobacteriales bacterium]